MSPRRGRRLQRGAALLVMVAIIGLGAAWIIVTDLHAESGGVEAVRKKRNAEVLNRAKQALIGYVAAQAAKSGEDNPGALPCPEADGYFDSATQDGQSGSSCTLPRVGRFPWRTIGTDKLVDAAGEPLWLAVSAGWARQSGNTVINSNSTGQLTVDGVGNAAVAVIIAPGPAFSVPAAAGCAAQNQSRVIAGTPNVANYLECDNATSGDGSFVTTGPSGSFNDQVITITAAEILPAIEAAIANRIEREIAPALQTMYSGSPWGGASSAPALPWAATFADPSTSAMKGVTNNLQGLLPLTNAETAPGSGILCTSGVAAPRCDPTWVAWSSANIALSGAQWGSCGVTSTVVTCQFFYNVCILPGTCGTTSEVAFTVNATANNVGRAMRRLNSSTANMGSVNSVSSHSAVLNSNSTATMALSGRAAVDGSLLSLWPNWICELFGGSLGATLGCKLGTITIPITVFADHDLLDSASTGGGSLGWFMRNKWHETAYYALAAGFAPNGSRSCVDSSTCLTVAFHRNSANVVDAGKQRAILLLSGRTLTGTPRPNGTPTDWFEGQNAASITAPNGTLFELRSATLPINRSFNDRIAVLSANP